MGEGTHLHHSVRLVVALVPRHLVLQDEVSGAGVNVLQLSLLAQVQLHQAHHALLDVEAPLRLIHMCLNLADDSLRVPEEDKS